VIFLALPSEVCNPVISFLSPIPKEISRNHFANFAFNFDRAKYERDFIKLRGGSTPTTSKISAGSGATARLTFWGLSNRCFQSQYRASSA
jgi:hypothetical protein